MPVKQPRRPCYNRVVAPGEIAMSPRTFLPALLAGALLVAFIPSVAARAETAPMERLMMLEAGGTLEVAPDGSVASVTVEDGIEAQLSTALSNSVRKLHFAPVLVDGQAVRALTGFKVVLLGRKDAGNFSITIDSIDFQTPKGMQAVKTDGASVDVTSRKMGPPVYPRDEQRNGRMAMVKLAIRVGPDGRAAEVVAVDSFLYDMHVREGQGSTSLRNFEKASIDAAKGWTFNVPQNAAGLDPREMTVATSILYTFIDGKELEQHGQWLYVHKQPKRPIAWLPRAQSQALADTALAAGAVSSGNGAFQLLEPIGGTPVF
jgi:hypothetical protein